MKQNEFVDAVAKTILAQYPETKVYIDEIPSGGAENWHISITNFKCERGLMRAHEMTLTALVRYFQGKNDREKYHEWVDETSRRLARVQVGGGFVNTFGHEAHYDSEFGAFCLEIRAKIAFSRDEIDEDDSEIMEKLVQNDEK